MLAPLSSERPFLLHPQASQRKGCCRHWLTSRCLWYTEVCVCYVEGVKLNALGIQSGTEICVCYVEGVKLNAPGIQSGTGIGVWNVEGMK